MNAMCHPLMGQCSYALHSIKYHVLMRAVISSDPSKLVTSCKHAVVPCFYIRRLLIPL